MSGKQEIDRAIEESLRFEVRAGYVPLRRIVTKVLYDHEVRGSHYQACVAKAKLIVQSEVEAIEREQASWPEVTEFERLCAAFEELERLGILARQHHGFEDDESLGMIQEEIESLEDRNYDIKGYVYFHQQDTWIAVDGQGLSLRSESNAEDAGDEQDAEVARLVVEILRKHGLEVTWSGDVRTVIEVTMPWRRRVDAAKKAEKKKVLLPKKPRKPGARKVEVAEEGRFWKLHQCGTTKKDRNGSRMWKVDATMSLEDERAVRSPGPFPGFKDPVVLVAERLDGREDMPWLLGGPEPLVSDRVRKLFESFGPQPIEFVPASISHEGVDIGESYWFVRSPTRIDCADPDESHVVPLGKEDWYYLVLGVDASKIPAGTHVFFAERCLSGPVISDAVRVAMKNQKITGWWLQRAWSSRNFTMGNDG